MKSPPPSEVRSLLLAKFDALLAECDQVADNAAYGQTLHDMDEFFFYKGREFIQDVFQQKLQERIERAETQDGQQCPDCKKKRTSKIKKRKR